MDNNSKKVQPASQENVEWILYHRRWLMLFIFAFFSMMSSFQWIQYSSIRNITAKYYDVDGTIVDWLSMVFMVTFIPLIFPASNFLDKKGLRWTVVLGTLGTAAGACIKIASVKPDLFWVTFIGQTLVAASQVFMLSVPPTLAAVWFGTDEVSTACSIGVFGNLLGIAVGFLIPPIVVKNSNKLDDIGTGLSNLFYGTAAFAVTVFILAVLFFQARPPTPPSAQQAYQKENASKNQVGFWSLVKRLFLNKVYVMLLIGYAINQGVFNAFSTLLNELILTYFENGEEFGGRIGLVFVVSGMFAGVLFGFILDRTHRFKEVTLAVFALSLVGMLVFTFTLALQSEPIVYVSAIILGSFLGGYMPIAYDFAAEITYPEPEGMTAGIFTLPTQLSGTLFTLAYGPMIKSLGDMWANVVMCIALLIGTILHVIIRPDLRRQAVTTSTANLVKA